MGYTEPAISQFYGAIQCVVIFQFSLHNEQLIGHIICACRIDTEKRITYSCYALCPVGDLIFVSHLGLLSVSERRASLIVHAVDFFLYELI